MITHGFKNLKVWKKAYDLTLKVYDITKDYPQIENYGLISQMRRASTSIIANIAEGYGRNNLPGYIYYISIAISSTNELDVYFMLSLDLKYLKKKDYEDIKSIHTEIIKMLLGLRKSLNRKLKEIKSKL